MIIIYDGNGQTCNRLWAILPSIIEGIEHDESVCVLIPDKEFIHFPLLMSLIKTPFFPFRFLYRVKRYRNLLFRIFHARILVFLYNWINSKKIRFKFVEGWKDILDFDNPINMDTKIKLCSLFSPSKQIMLPIDNLMHTYRNSYDIIIGVHIRRGDYSTWRDGRYLYSVDQYINIMHKTKNIFKDKTVSFFISTNEKIEIPDSNLDYFRYTSESAIYDLYGLTKVDYIIGPPSSFSKWASFINNVPLYSIISPQKDISLDDFTLTKNFQRHYDEIGGKQIYNK